MPVNYPRYQIKLPFMSLDYDNDPKTASYILLMDSDHLCKSLYEYFKEPDDVVEEVFKQNKNNKFIMDTFKHCIMDMTVIKYPYNFNKLFDDYSGRESHKLIRTIIPFIPYEVCIDIKVYHDNSSDRSDYSTSWDYDIFNINIVDDINVLSEYPKIETFGSFYTNYRAIIKEYAGN